MTVLFLFIHAETVSNYIQQKKIKENND